MTIEARKRRTALLALAAVAAMTGLSFAAVPLYRAFCQATGWGGVTQRAEAAPDVVLERAMTIRFDAATDPGLPWRFKPEQPTQTLKIGKTGLAFYEAVNLSAAPVTGRAIFNVTPAKAGFYFRKIDCFCFQEQTLGPGERVSMPVSYFIDPSIAEDEYLDDVGTITLAYTFYAAEADGGDARAAE